MLGGREYYANFVSVVSDNEMKQEWINGGMYRVYSVLILGATLMLILLVAQASQQSNLPDVDYGV